MYKQILVAALLTAGAIESAETELFTCSESGAGSTYLKVCVSNTGNITLFKSPWAKEHIRVINGPGNDLWIDSFAIEGFLLCRWDPNGWAPGLGDWVGYYDFGAYYPSDPSYLRIWNGGWNAPYKFVQPNGPKKFPLTVFQLSYDGRFELKQEFSVDTQEREIAITMTLYNRSGTQMQDVMLARIASLNIDNTSEDESVLVGKRSVVQSDNGPPYGGNRDAVSVSATTPTYPVTYTSTDELYGDAIRDLCDGVKMDYVNGHIFNGMSYLFGNLGAGATRTVKFAYRAF